MILIIYVYMCTKFRKEMIFGSSIFFESVTKLYVYDDSYPKYHTRKVLNNKNHKYTN